MLLKKRPTMMLLSTNKPKVCRFMLFKKQPDYVKRAASCMEISLVVCDNSHGGYNCGNARGGAHSLRSASRTKTDATRGMTWQKNMICDMICDTSYHVLILMYHIMWHVTWFVDFVLEINWIWQFRETSSLCITPFPCDMIFIICNLILMW